MSLLNKKRSIKSINGRFGKVRGHLILRVNHEWPAASPHHKDSILCGDIIPRQPFSIPLSDLIGIS